MLNGWMWRLEPTSAGRFMLTVSKDGLSAHTIDALELEKFVRARGNQPKEGTSGELHLAKDADIERCRALTIEKA